MKDNVSKQEAIIVEEEGKTLIHLGQLSIHIIEEGSQAGPLGWEDGQNPGIILWKSDYIKKHQNFFEHGEQKPIFFQNFDKSTAKEIREILEKEGE